MINLNNLPIGVFDSGIGGLTVLNKLIKTYKGESFVYFGDNLNAPYGNKTKQELKRVCKNAVDKLLEYKVKAVVIACNTASTNCLEYLKKEFPSLTFIGTFPTIKNSKNTILFATLKTSKSDYVKKNFYKCKIVPLKNLASDVESYYLYKTPINFKKIESETIVKYKTVVLGCTHYLFLKKQFKKLFNCPVLDGLKGVVSALKGELNCVSKINSERYLTFIGKCANLNCAVYKKAFRVESGCKVVIKP